jgi:L-threonylcarbamoyladenylate synthase
MSPVPPPAAEFAQAISVLLAGGLVAMPTETVYGLAGDAMNPKAVARIFALKGRPADHPLIVHVTPEAALEDWAVGIPEAARRLRDAFWPGPLTIILKKSDRVPALVTGGQDSVGLRCPSHPVAQRLLREFAAVGSGAIAAPSANKFGHVSPTTAGHVRDEFGPGLLIVDGGACEVGLESTIVDLSRGEAVLLRPGAITRDDLARVLGKPIRDRDSGAPRASGTLASHYAPRTPTELVESIALARRLREVAAAGKRVAVLARRGQADLPALAWREAPNDAAGYGHELYALLRDLDGNSADLILVESPPAASDWEAGRDRLARAAAGGDDADET